MNEQIEKMNMKLMIVEDEENIRNIMVTIMKKYVAEIITAENGEDGLKKFMEYKPDIILSDIRMPKMTGLEMIKKIKEINEDVYAIVMSAYDDSRYLMEAINSGVNTYIVKPVNREKLLNAARSFYKIKKLKDERDALQDKLEAEYEKYYSVFNENSAVKLIIDSSTGMIINANKSASVYYGYSHDEFITKSIYEINTASKEKIDEAMKAVYSGDKNKFSFRHRLSDGRVRDVEEYYGRLEIRNEKMLYLIIIDVTARNNFERELSLLKERLDFALEGNGDGIWDWDSGSNKVYYSKRWKEMLGYSEDEIENELSEWDKRLHPDDKARVYETLNKHLNGETGTYSCEHRMMTKNGSYKWILDRGKVVKRDENNKPVRVVGTHTDIDEKKRMEEEIHRNKLMKDKIYSIIAHDLRGPVGNTERFLDMFIKQYNTFAESEKVEYTQEVWKTIKRVYDLLENLLDWTKTQRVEFLPDIRPQSISEIIKDTKMLLEKSAGNKNVTLIIEDKNDMVIDIDGNMIATVLRNLISNAIKFSYPGTQVMVKSYKANEKNIIEVSDSGTGINKAVLEKIFEVTNQKINEGTAGEKGTGLGLMICKEFVEKNGGNLEISSESGKGTTARIIL